MNEVLSVDDLLDEALSPSSIVRAATQKKPAILLALTDDRTLRMASTTLEAIGYRVYAVHDSFELFSILRATADIGLAFIDDRLPYANGMAITRKIHETGDRIPITILTAKINFWSNRTARKNGVAELAHYLIDPDRMLDIADQYFPLHAINHANPQQR